MSYQYQVRDDGGKLLGTLTTGVCLDDRGTFEIASVNGDSMTRVPLSIERWRNGDGSTDIILKIEPSQLSILSDLKGFVPGPMETAAMRKV